MGRKAVKRALKVEPYDDEPQVKRFIRRHPWESVGFAALLGGLLARLFFRRRR